MKRRQYFARFVSGDWESFMGTWKTRNQSGLKCPKVPRPLGRRFGIRFLEQRDMGT